ncbi:MAG: IS200/IS605 family transposase [Bacteroidales bacterium]|nr:IS200/IS605 family transposase [Bacteroidales bacterium]
MKPGTFTQLFIHLVFAVRYRECLFNRAQRSEVFKYVSGIVSNLNHKPIIINGYSDHVHILYSMHPSISVSDTVSEIKKSSSKFINQKGWFKGKFSWQDGYGAFSYSKSQVKAVYQYIFNQEQHHEKNNFRDEYIDMLNKSGIEFDERFLFNFNGENK